MTIESALKISIEFGNMRKEKEEISVQVEWLKVEKSEDKRVKSVIFVSEPK